MIKVIAQAGNENIAKVYLAQNKSGKYLEFAESLQPPYPMSEKWIMIISTLFGCVVGCPMCDAGGFYQGKLSKEELFAQIDYLVNLKFPDSKVNCKKFKIQFARMGEPSLNPAVLEVLTELPTHLQAPGLIPSFSTVAPLTDSTQVFFSQLLAIKNTHYSRGNFQLQFSIHSTDISKRDQMIPIKKWNFDQIAAYGDKFLNADDRKITLNFALAKNIPLEVSVLQKHFAADKFLIKLTPVNPTLNAMKNKIESYFVNGANNEDKNNIVEQLRSAGFEVIVSIGELEENKIGSNCGQYLKRFLSAKNIPESTCMYTYDINKK